MPIIGISRPNAKAGWQPTIHWAELRSPTHLHKSPPDPCAESTRRSQTVRREHRRQRILPNRRNRGSAPFVRCARSRNRHARSGGLARRNTSRDISEAGSYFAFNRLPELYAGIRRAEGTFPVQYLGANVPQAWAAGSVFHLLQAILGLHANAHKKTLYLNPVLPQWLPEITLHNLRVGTTTVTIRFWREEDQSRYDVLSSTQKSK